MNNIIIIRDCLCNTGAYNIISNSRFANPVPLAKGSLKDYQATKEANECIQPDYWDFSIIRGSEDCLYLYVYTPYVILVYSCNSKLRNLLLYIV